MYKRGDGWTVLLSPVHVLNVCLEPQCHQVLPKNVMTMSNIGHPQIGTHMDGAMFDVPWL